VNRLVEIKDIVAMLQQRAEGVVSALYNVALKSKGRLHLGDVTGNPGQSLSILLRNGSHPAGSWKDFSTGEHGDILDLIAHAKYGGDRKAALAWARGFLGLDSFDPKRLQVERRRALADQEKSKRDGQADEAKRIAQARKLFFYEAVADLAGTPVAHYLRDERGLDIAEAPSTGACRYAADCFYGATGELLPAMVLCITGPDGKMRAVHRTYLERKDGVWRVIRDERGKALKLSLGPVTGGHVSVSKGEAQCPLVRAPAGDRVLIAEGYETALTYAIASPELRCISCVSLFNMGQVAIPATVTTRLLVKENYFSAQAEADFAKAVAFHQAQCGDVRIVETPTGFSDANDFWRDKRKGA
jgi:hypothetical protein